MKQKFFALKEADILDEAVDENLDHPTLTSEERAGLEGLISIQELSVAVQNLNNDKSPGSDGYTADFFKFFFKDVGMCLLSSINCGFEKGEMSVTEQQGVIRCIPKEGEDKSLLKNWRPITLLNIPYKIASSCIAQRLKSVLPHLIREDQKGFLKGRKNIRPLYDTLLYSSKHNVRGLLFRVDFEKAFDNVAWSFIKKSLIKFNFGSSIIRWISTFYCNIKSLRNSKTKFMPELNFTWNPATFKVLGVIFSTNIQEIVLLNYEKKLVQVRKLLNAWARRQLTHLAKSQL